MLGKKKKKCARSSDLVGSCHIKSGTVRSSGHVVVELHHLHLDVLGLQVVDEIGNIRVCLQKKHKAGRNEANREDEAYVGASNPTSYQRKSIHLSEMSVKTHLRNSEPGGW